MSPAKKARTTGATTSRWCQPRTNVANKIATSQIALPQATCDLVYTTTGYSQSIQNLSQVSLATDNVFSDGSALELATCTGTVTTGITTSLTVAV